MTLRYVIKSKLTIGHVFRSHAKFHRHKMRIILKLVCLVCKEQLLKYFLLEVDFIKVKSWVQSYFVLYAIILSTAKAQIVISGTKS